MNITIGEREFTLKPVKAKTLRKLWEVVDESGKITSMAGQLDKVYDFYLELLSPQFPDVTREWLEENLDGYQCMGGYIIDLLNVKLVAPPKNEGEPEVAE